MFETIGSFVAKAIASHAVNKQIKRVDHLFSGPHDAEGRLATIIRQTIEAYHQAHPIPNRGKQFPFYESEIFVAELLKFRFFRRDGYAFSEATIAKALQENPNIIVPATEELSRFLELFEQQVQNDPQLKTLEIDENYKSEVFHISAKFDQLLERLAAGTYLPKELTALTKIAQTEIVGRETELQTLRQRLLNDHETVLVNGMGGIGKTTLAAVYVAEFYNEYEHIAWLTIENTLEEAIAANYALLANLGLRETPPQEQFVACLNALRTVPGNGAKLLVLDNAHDTLTAHYDRLPKAPGWHLLVTSRERIARFHTMDLDFLNEPEAVALFETFKKGFAPAQVRDIITAVERHTLTVELLGKSAQRNRWNAAQTMAALGKDAKSGVSVHHHPQKIERIKSYLSSIFDTSHLGENETYLLKQFTALPNQWITYDVLAQLLQTEQLDWQEDVAATLETLWEKGFIAKDDTGDSYKMHPVLVEALTPRLQPTAADLNLLITAVTGLLRLDQTKDNPIDKFPFIPFGEAILKQLPDDASAEIAVLQNNLALRFKDMGNYERARELLASALQSDIANFGEQHPKVAIRQSNLANVYGDLGNYESARELLASALQSDVANFGEQHPTVAVHQSNLALVYQALGNYEGARELLEAALQSDIANFGEQHPTVAIRQSNLANVYGDLGNYERARELLASALQSDIASFGEQHPTVAVRQSNLAIVYRNLGNYERARELLEAALQSDIANFGEQHPEVAIKRSNLALVYQALGNYESARDLLEAALQSDIANFGEQHPNVAVSQSNLANVYSDLGNYDKARELFEKTLNIHKEIYEKNHPYIAQAQSNLANVYGDLGNYESARELLEAALQSDLDNFGEKHPNVAIDKQLLAYVHEKLGDTKKAVQFYTEAYHLFRSLLGEHHPHTRVTKQYLDNLVGRE